MVQEDSGDAGRGSQAPSSGKKEHVKVDTGAQGTNSEKGFVGGVKKNDDGFAPLSSASTKICSNCGTLGGNLKRCTACNYVYYCNRTCQKAHRKYHKKACQELANNPKAPPRRSVATTTSSSSANTRSWTPETECPICTAPFPHDGRDMTYFSCCGQSICTPCSEQLSLAELQKQRSAGDTNGLLFPCCFCRTPSSFDNEENLARLHARINHSSDPKAMETLACRYLNGLGILKDERKAFELLKCAAEIGVPTAASMVGEIYERGKHGIPVDKAEARRFYIQGAERSGSAPARRQLGEFEMRQKNYGEGKKHLQLAAAAGDDKALDYLKIMCEVGVASRDEYDTSRRALQSAKEAIESDTRKTLRKEMGDPEYMAMMREAIAEFCMRK